MRLVFLPALMAALLLVCAPLQAQQPLRPQPMLPRAPLTITTAHGTVTLQVELATTPHEQEMGLMFRRHMAEHAGMLFVFPQSAIQSFWMKNTILPLDMVFIRADGTVSSIHAHAVPFDLSDISSREPVPYVLELNAGAAQALDIKAGDRAKGPALQAGR